MNIMERHVAAYIIECVTKNEDNDSKKTQEILSAQKVRSDNELIETVARIFDRYPPRSKIAKLMAKNRFYEWIGDRENANKRLVFQDS